MRRCPTPAHHGPEQRFNLVDHRVPGEPLGGLAREGELKAWFQSMYETMFGASQGPRMGSFIALYGIAPTRALIARVLSGELSKG